MISYHDPIVRSHHNDSLKSSDSSSSLLELHKHQKSLTCLDLDWEYITMSSSKTPCAACKLQRRKCTPECVFAPYFPPENPQKFQNVHQVFGASNVSKLLSDLDVSQREEAVLSLAFEADARIKDPVYGCVGPISVMQHKLRYLHSEIEKAQKELALYEGALQLAGGLDPHHGGIVPPIHPAAAAAAAGNIYAASSVFPYNNMPVPQAMAAAAAAARGGGNLVIRDPQQQQQMLGSQLGAVDMEARQAQELFGIYNQQQQQAPSQQQKDFISYGGGGTVSGSGFNHQAAEMSASLSLNTFDNHHHQQQQNHQQHQTSRHNLQEQMLLLQSQQQQNQNNQLLHHHLQEQLILSSQQTHQRQEQQTQSQQQPQPQQQQQHQRHHHHHQLQEQLFLGAQQPQQKQQDQHNQHSQLQEQLLLPPQQAQSQQQEQSKDEDGADLEKEDDELEEEFKFLYK